MDEPRWLDDEHEVLQMLHLFINKLDDKPAEQWQRPISIPVKAKHFPLLFQSAGDAADQTWRCILQLANEFGIIQIGLKHKRNRLDPDYHDARISFCFDAEPLLRQWLGRPPQSSQKQRWQRAIKQQENLFPGNLERLKSKPISVPHKTPDQVIAAFGNIAQHLQQGLTLRQLSARCFWGDSKLLDKREELVKELYPGIQITARPIIVDVWLPETINGVLFIENKDTFCNTLLNPTPLTSQLAVVFSSGYMTSAQRIRQQAGARLFFQGSDRNITDFNAWWFATSNTNYPVYFWGDLDFSGMAILAALRQPFPQTQAWRPGYSRLLTELNAGHGHHVETASKQKQLDPAQTGCDYADLELLPALRKLKQFIDQEIIVLY